MKNYQTKNSRGQVKRQQKREESQQCEQMQEKTINLDGEKAQNKIYEREQVKNAFLKKIKNDAIIAYVDEKNLLFFGVLKDIPCEIVKISKISSRQKKYLRCKFFKQCLENEKKKYLFQIEDQYGDIGNAKVQERLLRQIPEFYKQPIQYKYTAKITINNQGLKTLSFSQKSFIQFDQPGNGESRKYPLFKDCQVSFKGDWKQHQIHNIDYTLCKELNLSGKLQIIKKILFFKPRSAQIDDMIPVSLPLALVNNIQQLNYYSITGFYKLKKKQIDEINNRLNNYIVFGHFHCWPSLSKHPFIQLQEKISPNCYQSIKQAIIYQYKIHGQDFDSEQLRQAEKIQNNIQQHIEMNKIQNKRVIFTIDSQGTQSRDDALSISQYNNSDIYQVGFHITNVAKWIQQTHYLNQRVQQRAQTIYIKDYHFNMLPQLLSNNWLSLNKGTRRAVISLYFSINEQGQIDFNSIKFIDQIVYIKQNYTYEQADELEQIKQLLDRLQKRQQLKKEKDVLGKYLSCRLISKLVKLNTYICGYIQFDNHRRLKQIRQRAQNDVRNINFEEQYQQAIQQIQNFKQIQEEITNDRKQKEKLQKQMENKIKALDNLISQKKQSKKLLQSGNDKKQEKKKEMNRNFNSNKQMLNNDFLIILDYPTPIQPQYAPQNNGNRRQNSKKAKRAAEFLYPIFNYFLRLNKDIPEQEEKRIKNKPTNIEEINYNFRAIKQHENEKVRNNDNTIIWKSSRLYRNYFQGIYIKNMQYFADLVQQLKNLPEYQEKPQSQSQPQPQEQLQQKPKQKNETRNKKKLKHKTQGQYIFEPKQEMYQKKQQQGDVIGQIYQNYQPQQIEKYLNYFQKVKVRAQSIKEYIRDKNQQKQLQIQKKANIIFEDCRKNKQKIDNLIVKINSGKQIKQEIEINLRKQIEKLQFFRQICYQLNLQNNQQTLNDLIQTIKSGIYFSIPTLIQSKYSILIQKKYLDNDLNQQNNKNFENFIERNTSETFKCNNPLRSYNSLVVQRFISDNIQIFRSMSKMEPHKVLQNSAKLNKISQQSSKIQNKKREDQKRMENQNNRIYKKISREIAKWKLYYQIKGEGLLQRRETFLNILSKYKKNKQIDMVYHQIMNQIPIEKQITRKRKFTQVKGILKIKSDFPLKFQIKID